MAHGTDDMHCKLFDQLHDHDILKSSIQLKLNRGLDVEALEVFRMRLPKLTERKPTLLEVDEEILPILDLVIVTWVFMEQRREGTFA